MRKFLYFILYIATLSLILSFIIDRNKEEEFYALTLEKEQIFLKDYDNEFKVTVYYTVNDNLFIDLENNEFQLYENADILELKLLNISKISKLKLYKENFYRYDYYFSLENIPKVNFLNAILKIKNQKSSIEFNIGHFEVKESNVDITIESNVKKAIPKVENNKLKELSIDLNLYLSNYDNLEVISSNYNYIIESPKVGDLILKLIIDSNYFIENTYVLVEFNKGTIYIPMTYYYLDYNLKDIVNYLNEGSVLSDNS